jgi:hypothetical protein
VCYNQKILGIGLDYPTEAVGSTDYLEMMEEFLHRAQGQIDQVRSNRERCNEPQEVFGAAQCLPGGMEHSLVGTVVLMKPEVLRPEHRNIASQIVLLTGGFGTAPNARGTAVFGNTVFSGEKSDWRRSDILGVLDPKQAPDWVKPGVDAIRAQQKEKGGKSHER